MANGTQPLIVVAYAFQPRPTISESRSDTPAPMVEYHNGTDCQIAGSLDGTPLSGHFHGLYLDFAFGAAEVNSAIGLKRQHSMLWNLETRAIAGLDRPIHVGEISKTKRI